MNRRQFFEKGTGMSGPDVELSCETLYMRCLDAQSVSVDESGSEDCDSVNIIDGLPSGGEPPTIHERRSRQELFEDLERALLEVRVLRVRQPQWLIGDIRRDFDRVIGSFRARGGRVIVG